MLGVVLHMDWGRQAYFIKFQNFPMSDMVIISQIPFFMSLIALLFLGKEICKGFCLIYDKYSAIMISSICNLIGLGGIFTLIMIFSNNTQHNALVGIYLVLGGLICEFLAYVHAVKKYQLAK